MYDYVIVHGSFGSPFENWFPWLFDQLESSGKSVLAPQFPCGKGVQSYQAWKQIMDAYKAYIDEHTTFIGHSLAPAFIVDYLIENELKVNKLVFAAPFYDLIGIEEFDEVNKSFFCFTNLAPVKKLVVGTTCFVSKNDPYVPNKLSADFSNQIGANIVYVENAGHFNKSAGYLKFESLFEIL